VLSLYDYHPNLGSFRDEVMAGLRKPQKELACKFFYDEQGAALFDAICALPEYYPTRTEIGIMQENAPEIRSLIGAAARIIEFGGGNSRKVRLLLDFLEQPAAYIPIDISRDYLFRGAEILAADYPQLEIAAVCADYLQPLELPQLKSATTGKAVVFFPGSTIGNLHHHDAARFLTNAHQVLGTDGGLLIGVDLKKDPAILHAAYNDRQGVTADFNLNLLRRINRELGGNFSIKDFSHEAVYNAAVGRIEMYLISQLAQQVSIDGQVFEFTPAERIHTENSYKYTIAEFQQLARSVGFRPRQVWQDGQQLFSIHYLEVAN
jgi:dimethylhistidine N-methyltransferase